MSRQVIVFDLDGTLIHSAPDLHAAANVALRAAGREDVSLAQVISFIGNGVGMLVERALKATGPWTAELQDGTLAAFMAFYEQNTTTLTAPYAGVTECLEELQAAGVVMGICTNKPQTPAREICEALGLSRFFGEICGARSDLARKPDPEPLLQTIRALDGDPSRTLYVGDSAVDYRTAQNAAVPFRLFSGGYLNHPLPNLGPDQIFDTWADAGFQRALTGLV
ncbi:phosphoglycolate phosphatase [Roseobacter ponti]|uniref:Phosphoglycolate phosphatase n=1 Tax=Roseobacter ponti TaxID=1891787 RepID=A0A858SSH0_9RHOB|nr:phosphoglycolate phosphatase [Roseobacter ponti]QJF51654.1 phosphoglycolate phosphatase [Roseobacter ponti]